MAQAQAAKVHAAKVQAAKVQAAKLQAARAHAAKVKAARAEAARAAAAKARAASKQPAKSPSSPAGPTGLAVKPLPSGGYVFAGGVLVTAANARSIKSVSFSDGCAAGMATTPLALAADGSFHFTGRLSNSVDVVLTGRFLDSSHASLRIQFHGAGCATKPQQLTARLS